MVVVCLWLPSEFIVEVKVEAGTSHTHRFGSMMEDGCYLAMCPDTAG